VRGARAAWPFNELDEDAAGRGRVEEERRPAVRRRLDVPDRLEARGTQAFDHSEQRLVHLEADVVESGSPPREKALDWASWARRNHELELAARAEARHCDATSHLDQLEGLASERLHEPVTRRRRHGDSDMIERDCLHQTTVEARW